MEYKIFHTIRQKIQLPYLIRLILGIPSLIIGIFFGFVPVLPGFVFVIIGLVLIIPGSKVREIIKMRRNIIYMVSNAHSFTIIKHKMFDIWTSFKKIWRGGSE